MVMKHSELRPAARSPCQVWATPIISSVLVSDYSYHLPEELIAQEALPDRAASRLLYLNRSTGEVRDLSFRGFPELLRSDDLVVFNNTRVFPARLYGHRDRKSTRLNSSHTVISYAVF